VQTKCNASIVLIGTHVPSIINPTWLGNEKLISEKVLNYVNTPDFSAFESESYSMVIDNERFQLTAKKDNFEQMNHLTTILKHYLSIFNNVQYQGLGINFKWFINYDDAEVRPQIGFKVNNLDNLDSILPNHEFMFGSIVKATTDKYQMNLSIEPDKNLLIYTFNFHFNLKGLSTDKISRYLDEYEIIYEKAKEIVNSTLGEV
jgi:hypothetical protein